MSADLNGPERTARDLTGLTALVTGASGGLGRAVSLALAAEGALVVGWGRSPEALEETGAQVVAADGEFVAQRVDLADREGLARAADAVSKAHDPAILVNLTGGPPPGPIVDVDADAWEAAFAAMVLPVLTLTSRLLPGMRRRGFGRVITCTSSGAVAPIPGLGISNTLRACLHGWSKTVAEEVAADGVTSNVVVPGRIDTPRVSQLDDARARNQGIGADEVRRSSEATIPLKRYGRPDEFASAVAFVAGRSASYITGSVIRVDGGLIRST